VPEHRLFDGVAMLSQDIQGTVELVKAEVACFGQPYPLEPALVAGELGARPVEPLRHPGQKGTRMRRRQLLLVTSGLEGLADAELGPECFGHVDDPELEAGLDRDATRTRSLGDGFPLSSLRTRWMLVTNRSRAARSSWSARPKLCTTLAST
jgi:hypothetical protein